MQSSATTLPEPRELETPGESPNGPVKGPVKGVVGRVAATLARPELHNPTLSLFDQAVVSATGFATSVIIGRLGSKEELGIFYLALTMVYLARGIQEQLIAAPYVIYCHTKRGPSQALYIGSTLLHQLVLIAVTMAVLLCVLGLLSIGIGPAGLAPAVWVLVGTIPFVQLREFIRRLAIAHFEMVTATAIDVAVGVFQIFGLLALAYFQWLNVTTAYVVMGSACAVACLGWLVARRRPIEFARAAAVADWWHNWTFARWALASHLILFATPYLMPWIVTSLLGSAEAGVLAACVSIVGPASMFITGLGAYLIPRAAMGFSTAGAPELRRVLRAAAFTYIAVLGSFSLAVLLSGDFILVLAFGDKYAGYGNVIGAMSLGMLALGMGQTAGIGLWAINRPKANLVSDVVTLVVTLAVVFCLLGPLGVFGAAVGDLAGKVVGAAVRFETLRRCLKSEKTPTELQ